MTKTFEIYFSDLNYEAQDRLLKATGLEADDNWGICPIAIYEIEEELNEQA